MAFRLVTVSCDGDCAGSVEKAYTGSARFLCRVCGSGICWHVPRGSRSGSFVEPEHHIQTIPAPCYAFLDVFFADHRASIQFLLAFWQSDDNAARITDICTAINFYCLLIPASFSPRRAPYLPVHQMVRGLYGSCLDIGLPGIFGLPLASAGDGGSTPGNIRHSVKSNIASICRSIPRT